MGGLARLTSNPLFRQPRKFFRCAAVIGPVACARLGVAAFRGETGPVVCSLQGHPLYLRPDSPDIEVLRSIFSEEEFKPLRHPDPRVIIDAGAHIGIASLYFAGRYPDARIIALEPEPENFSLLQRNTSPYPQITCLQAALWFEKTELEIHDRRKGNWSYTLCDMDRHSDATGKTTPCLGIPDLMEMYNLSRIDILKLDIEGAEKAVFDHSAAWMDRVSVVGVELHDRITPGCTESFKRAVGGFDIRPGGSEKWIAERPGLEPWHANVTG